MSEAKREICLPCKNQANVDRKDSPYKNLVKTGSMKMNARGNDASECYTLVVSAVVNGCGSLEIMDKDGSKRQNTCIR